MNTMELKKHIFVLALIVTLAVNSYAESHNIVVGVRNYGDKLLHQEHIQRDSELLRKVVIEKIFSVNGYITEIVAEDQKKNGNGAYASVIAGGPGLRYVKMKFKSQRGHGINFVVKIFGTQ